MLLNLSYEISLNTFLVTCRTRRESITEVSLLKIDVNGLRQSPFPPFPPFTSLVSVDIVVRLLVCARDRIQTVSAKLIDMPDCRSRDPTKTRGNKKKESRAVARHVDRLVQECDYLYIETPVNGIYLRFVHARYDTFASSAKSSPVCAESPVNSNVYKKYSQQFRSLSDFSRDAEETLSFTLRSKKGGEKNKKVP